MNLPSDVSAKTGLPTGGVGMGSMCKIMLNGADGAWCKVVPAKRFGALAVHLSDKGYGWRISHIKSGLAFPDVWKHSTRAAAIAQQANAFGDWDIAVSQHALGHSKAYEELKFRTQLLLASFKPSDRLPMSAQTASKIQLAKFMAMAS